jgi:hypothetical protein
MGSLSGMSERAALQAMTVNMIKADFNGVRKERWG